MLRQANIWHILACIRIRFDCENPRVPLGDALMFYDALRGVKMETRWKHLGLGRLAEWPWSSQVHQIIFWTEVFGSILDHVSFPSFLTMVTQG